MEGLVDADPDVSQAAVVRGVWGGSLCQLSAWLWLWLCQRLWLWLCCLAAALRRRLCLLAPARGDEHAWAVSHLPRLYVRHSEERALASLAAMVVRVAAGKPGGTGREVRCIYALKNDVGTR